jgi:membrane protease YdiL (CAAX protease family)
VDDTPAAVPLTPVQGATTGDAALRLPPRWIALFQTVMVCGIPTQLSLTLVLTRVFHMPLDPGDVSLEFFATLSLIDAAIIVLLIRTFLWHSGERTADVFVGTRPVRGEILRGLALVPAVFVAVAGIVLALRAVAPRLHTVELNPYEAFLGTPARAAVFFVVVIIAGGVREELQRAFILRRFEQRLGGAGMGLAVSSVAFGALHVVQGWDVAAAIGLLGLLWGVLYVRRRSVVLPMINHAGFDAIQVVQGFFLKSMGG